jgi:hypothetical protein
MPTSTEFACEVGRNLWTNLLDSSIRKRSAEPILCTSGGHKSFPGLLARGLVHLQPICRPAVLGQHLELRLLFWPLNHGGHGEENLR